ncbi:MAG: DUF2953 domain-containing protein, partial [Myxococcales bacterium]|nr:DUF2953 domain-containing protein [Myxococcales bacterium]
MLWILAALFALLVLPLILFAIAPLRVEGAWHFAGETPLNTRVSLFWGAVLVNVDVKSRKDGRMRLALFGRDVFERSLEQIAAAGARRKERPSRTRKKKRPAREVDWLEVLATLPPLLRQAVAVVLRRIDYRIYLELHYGFEDPSVTGMVSGLLSTLYAFFPRLEVALYPKFWQPSWDGIARFHVRFRPLGPGYRLIALLISRRGR